MRNLSARTSSRDAPDTSSALGTTARLAENAVQLEDLPGVDGDIHPTPLPTESADLESRDAFGPLPNEGNGTYSDDDSDVEGDTAAFLTTVNLADLEGAGAGNASGAGPQRRGWTFLNEIQSKQSAVREELGAFVEGVTESIKEGSSGVTYGDFSRMVHDLMRSSEFGDHSEDEDDASVTSADVDRYMSPFLNHPDERVRKGYEQIMKLDRIIDERLAKQEEFEKEAFPEDYQAKIEQEIKQRNDAMMKKLRREKKHRRRMAVLKVISLLESSFS